MATYYVRADGNNANTGTANTSGGAWADPGYAAATATGDGDIIYVQTGTYTLTTSTPGAGGPAHIASGVSAAVYGFETTPGDGCPNGNRPIIDVGSTTVTNNVIDLNGDFDDVQLVAHIKVQGKTDTGIGIGGTSDQSCYCYDCVVDKAGDNFLAAINSCTAIKCRVTNYYYVGISSNKVAFCLVSDGASGSTSSRTYGIQISNGNSTAVNCIVSNNGGGDDYRIGGSAINCVSYNATAGGFWIQYSGSCVNCVAYNATSNDFDHSNGDNGILVNCAGDGSIDSTLIQIGQITLTADPFIDAANGDFRLNTDSGGGALLANAGIGIPGQVNTIDIGAVPLDQLVTRFVPRLRG